MTPQNVIKSFTTKLANHGYTAGNETAMLDSAVRSSSRFTSIDEVISSIQADHINAESASIQTVITTVFGEATFNKNCLNADGSIKSLDEISNTLLNRVYGGMTVGDLIKDTTALVFLQESCGINLDNADTGAISGSDANLTVPATFFGDGGEQVLAALKNIYGDEAVLSSDGKTLILGTGVTKNADDIVPENFNTYTASNNAVQSISTGSKGWVVNATNKNDTIISDGADYISSGAGNDVITANADGSTISTGTGNDLITVSANVKQIKITDLSKNDELTILGTFEVGSACVEDMTLIITDKTGTRKLTLAQFQANTKVNVDGTSLTLGDWLADKVDWNWSTATEVADSGSSGSSTLDVNLDEISADSSSTVKVNGFVAGKLSNSYPNLDTFTANGLTVHLRGQASDIALTNIEPLTFDDLDDNQKIILSGLFKWWAKESLNLNEESFGLSFDDKATVHDVDLYFFYDSESSLAAILPNNRKNYDGITTALYLNVNLEPYQNISADNVNGKDDGGGYLDRTLAHEFNHAVLSAGINYFTNLPTFLKEGLAELTHGIDDERKDSILEVARDTSALAEQLDLYNPPEKSPETYAAGYIFLRYFAKQAATQTLYMPAFGEVNTVTVDFSKFNVAEGNVLYVDTSKATAVVKVAKNLSTFEKLDDPYNSLLVIGEICNLGDGTLYYYVHNDLIKQDIKLGGTITNVYNLNANTNLTGSNYADAIQLTEGRNSILAGNGADYLEVTGQYSTIDTGEGDDQIILFDGGHNNINLSNGDNYLELNGEPFSADGYIFSFLYENSISAGNGNDSLTNPDFRYFDADGYEVTADTENAIQSTFYGYHFNYNVDLGDGNNQIALTSLIDSSIRTGNGNDNISVTVLRNSTINAEDGNDVIFFSGDDNLIDAGAGNNVIYINGGSNSTIKTAAGVNYISINSATESFTVENFGEDDGIILESTPEIFDIENGKLVVDNTTITGISSIATFDYSYKSDANHLSRIKEMSPGAVLDTDEIYYSTLSGSETIFTITGLNSSVGVELDGNDIILTAEALANRKADTITVSDGYNLKIDGARNGVLTLAEAKDQTFADSIYTAAITAETFAEENGKIVYHKATGGQQFQLTGFNENAKLDEDILVGEAGKVTLKASALPEEISEGTTITLTDLKSGDGVNYSLTFDENIAQDDATHKGGWSGENGTFTFTEDYKLAHWNKNSNTYTFHEQSGGHKFTLSGFGSDLTADKFTSKTISVKKDATKGYTFKILSSEILPKTGEVSIVGVAGIEDIVAANCALALDSKIAAPKEIVESFKAKNSKYNYTAAGTSAGWSIVDGKIVYSAQVGGEQFELSGIKSNVKLNSGVTVADSIAKVFASALNPADKEKDGATILLTDDNKRYSLQFDSEILQAAKKIPGAFTNIKDGKATYTATHTLSYYEPTAENTFTYRKQDAAKKITISNLKKTTTLDDLDAVTVTESNDGSFKIAFVDDKILDAKAPSISADKGVTYTVEVADKLQPALQDADWFVKNTNASLKADTSAGYSVKNNKVVYSKIQTGKPQVILTGIEKNASFNLPAENILTLEATTLGTKSSLKSNAVNLKVKLTGDMKDKKFFGTSGSDTLIISANNAYVEGGKGDDEFSVTGEAVTLVGGKGNDKYNARNSSVIVYNKGDGLDTVNYAKGLKISLGGSLEPVNVAQSNSNFVLNFGKGDSINVTDMNDTLEVVNKKESFILDKNKANLGDKLTFDAKSTSVTIASSFTGTITPADDIYLSKGKISNVSTIDASNVAGKVLIVGNSKANTIIGGKNSTLEGGKGNDVFVYSGGKLTISDYGNGTDKISLGSAVYKNYSINDDDVILGFGSGNSLTVADSAEKPITLVEGKNSTVNVYSKDAIFNSSMTSATLSGNTFDASDYSKLVTISAANSSKNVKITGNAKANVIIGGNGNDTFTGGEGKDTFIYNGKGADVITDYAVDDKISLDTGLRLSDVSVNGQDATLSFAESGTLKLVGVGDKKVTVVETSINAKGKKVSKSNIYIFEDKKIFDANKTAITITGNNFDAESYSTLATIVASNDSDVTISGNSKNNVIIGGNGDDSLWGGVGNDILMGGNGTDVFVYKPGEGKDTITDYESGELLSILGGTFKNSSFNKNTLTLSIDGGGSVIFKNVTSSTAFNVNGTTYKVNGKTLA